MQGREQAVIIIGAGFAGIGLAIQLKRNGWNNMTLLERADGLGGVWRANRYPGAACDIPTPLYSFSFEPDYPWSAPYAPQGEILAYLHHCVDQYGLGPHLRFGAQVRRADWCSSQGQWTVECTDGKRLSCDVLVSAVGIFNTPVIPALAGRASFAGASFHSADWRDDVSFAGRRVAVIGTGASAIQIVPQLARVAARVDVLQRTPPYVMPRKSVDMQDLAGERQRIFREFDAASDRRKSPVLVQDTQEAFRAHLEQCVPDPALRRRLMPDYVFGCKRTLFSDDWYPALQQPNVHVISCGIERLTVSGLQLADGTEREIDAIVYATGFDPARYLPGIEVQADEARLADAWRHGAEAHLGITVAGFPNFFLMYGPNTNVAGSVIHMQECQASYIAGCLQAMGERGARSMSVRADVMRRSCEAVQERLRASVLDASHCHSYMMDRSGRVVTNYPGSQSDYEAETARVDAEEYVFC
ncbi:MAG TPA: NAD(P)/FAD-dependent oxidoreductase [Ramlibacter sp.]|nr:NAD(P)/FAD-dependent oxidoreductase [Ramlibacter sp.]